MSRKLRSASSQRRQSWASFHEDTENKVQEDMQMEARKLELTRKRIINLELAIKDIEGEIAVNKEEIIKNNKSKDQVNNKFTYTKSLNSKKKTDILRKKSDQIDGFINEIKDEIDQLRKQKTILKRNIAQCSQDIRNIDERVYQHHNTTQSKNISAEQTLMQLTSLKEQITKQQSSFHKKFKMLKTNFEWQVLNNLKSNSKYSTDKQFDNFDTATMLKRQLQSIILNNKEKVKMIDSYQRNMRVLDDAFNTIKETSGLTNINEIQAIFVKSQEQNCALLTYLDMLNQQIDALDDSNQELEERCKLQQKENAEREILLNSMPEEQRKRALLKEMAEEKIQLVTEVTNLIGVLSPNILETIGRLKGIAPSQDSSVTRFNFERYLGQIDTLLNAMIRKKTREIDEELVEKVIGVDKLPDTQPNMLHVRNLDYIPDVPLENNQIMYDYSKLQEVAKEAVKKIAQKKESMTGSILKRKQLS